MLSAKYCLAIATLQSVPSCQFASLVFPCLIPARVFWIYPYSLALWTLFASRLDYCSYTWIISLPSPCWILFADRRPTLALGLLFCLALYIPVCQCLTHAFFRPLMLIKPCRWIRSSHVSSFPLQFIQETCNFVVII